MKPLPPKSPSGEGSFFRRWKQKYYPLSAGVPGTIYYCLTTEGERLRICCHTKNEAVARRLIKAHLNKIDLSTEEKFLETIAKAGEKARRQLETKLSKKR